MFKFTRYQIRIATRKTPSAFSMGYGRIFTDEVVMLIDWIDQNRIKIRVNTSIFV
jgi:hypothetical protein